MYVFQGMNLRDPIINITVYVNIFIMSVHIYIYIQFVNKKLHRKELVVMKSVKKTNRKTFNNFIVFKITHTQD